MFDLTALEKRLGVVFADKALLEQALTHSSYVNENPTQGRRSNERLEFLGDAFLNLVVAQELFQRCPDCPEGEMTRLRAYVVKGESLAKVAEELELGAHLLMGRGEEASGGRKKASNLAAALEAVVGAVFVDRGYEMAGDLVLRLLRPWIREASSGELPVDPKVRLNETIQARGMAPPAYRVVRVEGPEHARRFTVEVRAGDRVLGRGQGGRKQDAERAAAREALGMLEGLKSHREARGDVRE